MQRTRSQEPSARKQASDRQAEVVTRFLTSGRSVAVIAREFDLDEPTVRQWIEKAAAEAAPPPAVATLSAGDDLYEMVTAWSFDEEDGAGEAASLDGGDCSPEDVSASAGYRAQVVAWFVATGKAVAEVAAELGLSEATVWEWVREAADEVAPGPAIRPAGPPVEVEQPATPVESAENVVVSDDVAEAWAQLINKTYPTGRPTLTPEGENAETPGAAHPAPSGRGKSLRKGPRLRRRRGAAAVNGGMQAPAEDSPWAPPSELRLAGSNPPASDSAMSESIRRGRRAVQAAAAKEAQLTAAEAAERAASEEALRLSAEAAERAEAERAAAEAAEREAAEQAAREAAAEAAERETAERAAAEAAERAAAEAAERAAAEAAEREAAEQAAREAAAEAAERTAREAAEQAAREAAERAAREAAEQAAKEAAERAAAEAAERFAAERAAREAAEQAAKEAAERAAAEAAERFAAERAAREVAEQAAKEAAERAAEEAAERRAAELWASEAADRAAKEAAERSAFQRAAAEAAERFAVERAAREAAERAATDAAERFAVERAAREAAERAATRAAQWIETERAAHAAERSAAERAAAQSGVAGAEGAPEAIRLTAGVSRSVAFAALVKPVAARGVRWEARLFGPPAPGTSGLNGEASDEDFEPRSVEASGRTEAEARRAALELLGVDDADAHVEVLRSEGHGLRRRIIVRAVTAATAQFVVTATAVPAAAPVDLIGDHGTDRAPDRPDHAASPEESGEDNGESGEGFGAAGGLDADWVEGSGRTEAEARRMALDRLGVDDADADVEVIASEASRLRRRVQVRARIRTARH